MIRADGTSFQILSVQSDIFLSLSWCLIQGTNPPVGGSVVPLALPF